MYTGELTTGGMINSVKRIKAAFPALPPGWYDILTDQLAQSDFSDERLADAVNHVINTCEYPTPAIARFISFDRTREVS